MSQPMSEPTPEESAGPQESTARDLSAAEASKSLLQHMEELLATVSANLAGLGADLHASATRAPGPDEAQDGPQR
ncbi:hypothetical protein [Kitasatospora sp. NPDC059571]|uniref:hypothetical protein n=1 Tax=Kitasatospora sp. NPDC059571 TaxID=3346871 RepID=UPI0036B1DB67